ncbi:MAG: Asp-tRNA(Asn)/Glu-tRNA(Gln) amidotransferase subunit GatC [Coriobacteriia bacterium]|nr:Asp-tRNA(Asn)/Glu-tRNA(Gln) amidotransferase subunit GatC [Coriobacteriia bacterium]
MDLTEDRLRAIANDARIHLSDAELSEMTADLNLILDRIKKINEFDLSDVPPTYQPIAGHTNVMRDDVPLPSLPQETALANAAVSENGQFKVPPILDELGSGQ